MRLAFHVRVLGVLVCVAIGSPLIARAQTKAQPRPTDKNVRPAQATEPAPAQRGGNAQAPPGRPPGGPQQPAMQQQPGAQQPSAAPQPNGMITIAPRAPFTLTPAEEKLLDQVLVKWEKESDKIKSFKCSFDLWEYDKAWGNPADHNQKTVATGAIHFRAPDWGDYEVKDLKEYNPASRKLEVQTTGMAHWRCDGKYIFEYDFKNKLLIQRTLPEELQGKAIADGPLPFVFGAKAKQLKDRYWMKDVTRELARDAIGKEVWLEAWPKRQADAANFHHATVMLEDTTFKPKALRIYLPDGENHSVYAFKDPKINDPLFKITNLLPISVPLGWRKVVDPAAPGAASGPQPPAAKPEQATRPPEPATKRK